MTAQKADTLLNVYMKNNQGMDYSQIMMKCEQNKSKTVDTIKDKRLKLLSFMERETRLSWIIGSS